MRKRAEFKSTNDKLIVLGKIDLELFESKIVEVKDRILKIEQIEEKIAEGVREALKTERKEPSKATQVSEPVNHAAIKKNWFEEIV